MERKYDLEERCLEFSAAILRFINTMPTTQAGLHLSKQLLRSGTNPALQYGEVLGAESKADFIHKMGIAHKELRETRNNLRLQGKAKMMDPEVKENAWLIKECNELVLIFSASIKTAERNRLKKT
jgi:four helix bundle protein